MPWREALGPRHPRAAVMRRPAWSGVDEPVHGPRIHHNLHRPISQTVQKNARTTAGACGPGEWLAEVLVWPPLLCNRDVGRDAPLHADHLGRRVSDVPDAGRRTVHRDIRLSVGVEVTC